MFGKVMAAALAIGAMGGATLAVAQNAPALMAPPATAAKQVSEGAPCETTAFRIYFEEDSAALNHEARDTIDSAARTVAGCAGVEFNIAADTDMIAQGAGRRLAAQRSVAVLSALRQKGVTGDVYVAPLSETVIAAERNAGPDFVEVAMNPVEAAPRIASNDRPGHGG
jgi:outer membrane protein OmpA-like peptidoglycan-associated protein